MSNRASEAESLSGEFVATGRFTRNCSNISVKNLDLQIVGEHFFLGAEDRCCVYVILDARTSGLGYISWWGTMVGPAVEMQFKQSGGRRRSELPELKLHMAAQG